MTNISIRTLALDGIMLHADRVFDDPDGYDRINARDPRNGQLVVEISWHRDARQLGLTLHADRRWSFEAVEEMRALGTDWLSWSEGAVAT